MPSKKNKINSHQYIIKRIGDELRDYSKSEFAKYHRKINDLKIFRVDSDYKDIQITATESNTAFEYALAIREQIEQTFRV